LGCFSGIILGLLLLAVVVGLIAPWAYRIGGRWTPGFWGGFGKLRTETGQEYPIYINFHLDIQNTSRLRVNGSLPTGVSGTGWLCSAQGVMQFLDLSGDIYGAYRSTDGKQMGFRLLDYRKSFRIGPQRQRYADFIGRWHGPELVMEEDDGSWERGFDPRPHDPKQQAKITFAWGSYQQFKDLCNATPIPEKTRILPPPN
jgi:hypothetical protein